ncbi:hypothetical protein V5799_014838 [Amblyomma americanum]|uniref:Transcriptional adapter 2-alpha/beta-like domain-containing protein n=1 Tax=Amblyomma americanum TaxID=6943 RepID=A0AAQ4E1V9_AMBAM
MSRSACRPGAAKRFKSTTTTTTLWATLGEVSEGLCYYIWLPKVSCVQMLLSLLNAAFEARSKACFDLPWGVQRDRHQKCSCPLSPSLSSAVAPVDITPSEQQELGYMPCRDDYEREYDNEAESLISQLSVGGPEEDELETALKLAQVDMYSRRLRERMRRKGLVRDYRLLEQFCHAGRPKASPVGARSKRNLREADR